MSSYWQADDTMRIGETIISVPSENGLEYTGGQKVQIFVPPSTKYMSGRESYLDFDVKISLPTGTPVPTRLQLDEMGGSSLIRNIRIYDGSRGQLLEEINDYSSYVGVKYDYDSDDSMRNMRALREGATSHTPANRGTKGTSQTLLADTHTNPYFKRTTGNQTTAFSNTDFLTAKCCVPLHTGIFANNDSIFPILLTGGLYIEIDLQDPERVIKQLDSVLRTRRTPLNPVFHSLNGSIAAPNNWGAIAGAVTEFFIAKDNNLFEGGGGDNLVSRCPFVVGETFNFCLDTDNASTPGAFSVPLEILELNASANGLIQVVLKTGSTITGTLVAGGPVMFSTAVEDKTSYDATYVMSNVSLQISQVHLDPAYERGMLQKVSEGKAVEFDIHTLTNYKHSILAGDLQTTFQIFAQNSRAKSLLVIPQDASVYTTAQLLSSTGTYNILGATTGGADVDPDDTCLLSNRSAMSGVIDELQTIQYQLNGRLVPSRPVSVAKISTRASIDAFHLYELEKCLDNAGIVPRSFSKFNENFVFGRGFGVNRSVLDLRGKDLAVILKYTGATPQKNKLFNSYVFHIRRLIIKDSSVSVVL